MNDKAQAKTEWEINRALLELTTLQGTLVLIHNKLRKQDYETAEQYLEVAMVRTETTLLALEKTLINHEQNN